MAEAELMALPQKQFNAYSAGRKVYGGGRDAPNIGPVDPTGYRERDRQIAARKKAIIKRMKAIAKGKYMSSEALQPNPYLDRLGRD
jgi:hypothetical protein